MSLKTIMTFLFVLFLLIQRGYTQREEISPITKTLASLDEYHYHGQMRFKNIGVDTFKIRTFTISYKSNPDNFVYGYDFEIAEHVPGGEIYSLIVKQDAFYILYTGSRALTQRPLGAIDSLSLLEYLRSYFILEEVFAHFLPDPTMMKVSEDSIYLSRYVGQAYSKLLVLDRQTYLPVQFLDTVHDDNWNPLQITEIIFDFGGDYGQLPEHALNPDYYINSGYTLKVMLD